MDSLQNTLQVLLPNLKLQVLSEMVGFRSDGGVCISPSLPFVDRWPLCKSKCAVAGLSEDELRDWSTTRWFYRFRKRLWYRLVRRIDVDAVHNAYWAHVLIRLESCTSANLDQDLVHCVENVIRRPLKLNKIPALEALFNRLGDILPWMLPDSEVPTGARSYVNRLKKLYSSQGKGSSGNDSTQTPPNDPRILARWGSILSKIARASRVARPFLRLFYQRGKRMRLSEIARTFSVYHYRAEAHRTSSAMPEKSVEFDLLMKEDNHESVQNANEPQAQEGHFMKPLWNGMKNLWKGVQNAMEVSGVSELKKFQRDRQRITDACVFQQQSLLDRRIGGEELREKLLKNKEWFVTELKKKITNIQSNIHVNVRNSFLDEQEEHIKKIAQDLQKQEEQTIERRIEAMQKWFPKDRIDYDQESIESGFFLELQQWIVAIQLTALSPDFPKNLELPVNFPVHLHSSIMDFFKWLENNKQWSLLYVQAISSFQHRDYSLELDYEAKQCFLQAQQLFRWANREEEDQDEHYQLLLNIYKKLQDSFLESAKNNIVLKIQAAIEALEALLKHYKSVLEISTVDFLELDKLFIIEKMQIINRVYEDTELMQIFNIYPALRKLCSPQLSNVEQKVTQDWKNLCTSKSTTSTSLFSKRESVLSNPVEAISVVNTDVAVSHSVDPVVPEMDHVDLYSHEESTASVSSPLQAPAALSADPVRQVATDEHLVAKNPLVGSSEETIRILGQLSKVDPIVKTIFSPSLR